MNRGVLAAVAAIVAYAPAQADLTVVMTGTAEYDATPIFGDPQSTFDIFGQTATFSATIVLTRGEQLEGVADRTTTFYGTTTGFAVNGVNIGTGPTEGGLLLMRRIGNGTVPTLDFISAVQTQPKGYTLQVSYKFQFDPFGPTPRDAAQYGPLLTNNLVLNAGGGTGAIYKVQNISYQFSGDDPAVTRVIEDGVPEPASWALMIIGFGSIGGAMRAGRALRPDRRLA